MTLSLSGSAVSARATIDASLQRLSPTPAVDRRASEGRAPAVGSTSALGALGKAAEGADSEEAWARIDTLLQQMRQLTLGAADVATSSATTTAQAISAYSQNARASQRA